MKFILIAEDDAMFRDAMIDVLKRMPEDIDIITAGDGAEALGILRSRPIDLLITDLQMPRMDGFALLAHTVSEFNRLPCIVITGYAANLHQFRLMAKALEPKVGKVLENSRFRFFSKPFRFDQLVEAIGELLPGNARRGILEGISMEGFIQLLEIECKTCRVDIAGKFGVQGVMFFHQGRLFDAEFRNQRGEEAALALLVLDRPKITFREIDEQAFPVQRSISTSAMALLMEAARRKDEKQFTHQPPGLAGTTNHANQ